jgi:hypothetical protein
VSFLCKLCGLTLDEIPDDVILIGKLHRFPNGEFHLLRKVLAPRTGPRPRKSTNPDREAPAPSTTQSTVGRHAEVPRPPEKTPEHEPEPVQDEAPVGETVLGRAFRLSKLIGEVAA